MSFSWLVRALIIAGGVAALSGCEKESATAQEAVPSDREPEASNEPAFSHAWREIEQKELTAEQNEALRRAVSARTSLGAKLIGTLTETIQNHGPAEAVRVCSVLAPRFAADIGQQYGVAVGRSSIRLRNTHNLPPAWADDIIAANEARDVVLVGPEDRVATLTPILTGALCTRCHGVADRIDEDVLAAIQKDYPLDQATGFENGDLRGWFWVEAPIASAPPVYNESGPDDLDELWMQLAHPPDGSLPNGVEIENSPSERDDAPQ